MKNIQSTGNQKTQRQRDLVFASMIGKDKSKRKTRKCNADNNNDANERGIRFIIFLTKK